MAEKRGLLLAYSDAVVVETTHGLFSSDEIHPNARLTKKEQAARDKQLGKHKYCDRQQVNYKIISQFKNELCESIKRHRDLGLQVGEKFIEAPCTYLPEIQICRSGPDGRNESIGSKSRHHEWDRLLKRAPANWKLKTLTVVIDRSFKREQNTLQKLFRTVIKRRTWLPDPQIVVADLNEIVKIWSQRQQNGISYKSDRPVDTNKLNDFFGQYGLVSSVKPANKTDGIIYFRNSGCVAQVLIKSPYKIGNAKVRVEPYLKMNRHQQKICGNGIESIKKAEALIVFLPGKEGSTRVTHLKNRLTMFINGEEGVNPCALQFIMQIHIRRDSRKSFAILQEAIEAGLVPKTGAITFEIDQKRCDFDIVIAIDVSQDRHGPTNHDGKKVVSLVATDKPFEGSIGGMCSIVSLIDAKGVKGDVIPYEKMMELLKRVKLKGRNILIYRHNCSVEYKEVYHNEIRGALNHFKDSHITFVEVTSYSSLRILDIPFSHLGNRQARGEFIVTKKVTQTWRKALEFHIRHIEKSNPVKYSIIYSTNRVLLTSDLEVLNIATFTHNLTKNYVHHKDGSKLPGPLKYADHVSRLYSSIMKSNTGKTLPRFHPKTVRPTVV